MIRYKFILLLLFISASVSSQTNWNTYLSEITPLQFDLPGNDVYYTLNDDGDSNNEGLIKCLDFTKEISKALKHN